MTGATTGRTLAALAAAFAVLMIRVHFRKEAHPKTSVGMSAAATDQKAESDDGIGGTAAVSGLTYP
jgi:hypothetical protein